MTEVCTHSMTLKQGNKIFESDKINVNVSGSQTGHNIDCPGNFICFNITVKAFPDQTFF